MRSRLQTATRCDKMGRRQDMLKAGVVGFLPDDRSKTEETWKLLEKYAEIGYRAMDMDLDYAIPGGDLKEKYERVCSLGIKPIMSGASRGLSGPGGED